MSKKNNKKIIARKHAHDLQLEKAAQEKLKKTLEKAERKKERQLAATGAVKTKRKGLRIRKGVKVKGIKVTDSESKRKVLDILKQEQAEKLMDVEGPAAEEKAAKKPKKRSKLKMVTKTTGGSNKTSAAAAAAATPAPMEA